MNEKLAINATKGIMAALKEDAAELRFRIDMAGDDIFQNERNACVGALSGTDEIIERIAAAISVIRSVNRAVR